MEMVAWCHGRSTFLLLPRFPSRNYINSLYTRNSSSSSSSSSLSSSSSSSICVCHRPWRGRDGVHHRSARRRIAAFASSSAQNRQDTQVGYGAPEPTEEDLECVSQIKRVLELLRKNRDMSFGEVKLTIMIEDPREAERRQTLELDDPDYVTREEIVAALEDVNKGRIPEDRSALRKLADELIQWPNLEVEATKKKPRKSLYAKATDTGIDPVLAAKRLNIDWDTAAEIESDEDNDETDVPPAVGYGVLYLVTGLPIIIGISVVLILFYNSLQ
ncbi:ycf3-interacting protein 1, chloroplastic isoform X1 [Nymphaea colorata]|nr:ycf3-interacting protein 1, chloroplastic isoform X1 [Nymphaea colorata]